MIQSSRFCFWGIAKGTVFDSIKRHAFCYNPKMGECYSVLSG